MIGGLFAGKNPFDLVPPAYRPAVREMTPAERDLALHKGMIGLDTFFGGQRDGE